MTLSVLQAERDRPPLQPPSIYEPVQEQLDHIEDSLKELSKLKFPFLAQILDKLFEIAGKKVRPAVTLLSSNFHPHDSLKTEIMATAVELLHIATLIHDDTVDNAGIRHGKATLSNLWGPNVAVLTGDYIFATSATFVCDTGEIRVVRRFSETIMELASGQLQETAEAFNPNQNMEHYLNRIYNKTASLFTTASESGSILSGAPETDVHTLKDYGYNLGMAFQIVDDILDLAGNEMELGKPVGKDLSRGIMNLPSIMAMERYPNDNPIPMVFQYPNDENYLNQAVDMIQNSSIIDDAYSISNGFCDKAHKALKTLPRNPSRDSLDQLLEHILTRRG